MQALSDSPTSPTHSTRTSPSQSSPHRTSTTPNRPYKDLSQDPDFSWFPYPPTSAYWKVTQITSPPIFPYSPQLSSFTLIHTRSVMILPSWRVSRQIPHSHWPRYNQSAKAWLVANTATIRPDLGPSHKEQSQAFNQALFQAFLNKRNPNNPKHST